MPDFRGILGTTGQQDMFSMMMHMQQLGQMPQYMRPYTPPNTPMMNPMVPYTPMAQSAIPAYPGVFNVPNIPSLGPMGNYGMQMMNMWVSKTVLPKVLGIPSDQLMPMFGRYNATDVYRRRGQWNDLNSLMGQAGVINQGAIGRGISDILGAVGPGDPQAREARDDLARSISSFSGLPIVGQMVDFLTPGGSARKLAEGVWRTGGLSKTGPGARGMRGADMRSLMSSIEGSIAPGGALENGLGFTMGLSRGEIGGVSYGLAQRGLRPDIASGAKNANWSKYKETLGEYNKVARALSDLFGGQDMGQLMTNLDRMTAGSSMGMDSKRLLRLVQNVSSVSRIAGVSEAEVVANMEASSAQARSLGLPGFAGAQIAQGSLLFGANAFGMGRPGVLSANQREWTAVAQKRMMGGANSYMTGRMGAIFRYADFGGRGFDADTMASIKTFQDAGASSADRQAAFDSIFSQSGKLVGLMGDRMGAGLANRLVNDQESKAYANQYDIGGYMMGVQQKRLDANILRRVTGVLGDRGAANKFLKDFRGITVGQGETFEEAFGKQFAGNERALGLLPVIGAEVKRAGLGQYGTGEEYYRQFRAAQETKASRGVMEKNNLVGDLVQEALADRGGGGIGAIIMRVKAAEIEARAKGLAPGAVARVASGAFSSLGSRGHKLLSEAGENNPALGLEIAKGRYYEVSKTLEGLEESYADAGDGTTEKDNYGTAISNMKKRQQTYLKDIQKYGGSTTYNHLDQIMADGGAGTGIDEITRSFEKRNIQQTAIMNALKKGSTAEGLLDMILRELKNFFGWAKSKPAGGKNRADRPENEQGDKDHDFDPPDNSGGAPSNGPEDPGNNPGGGR
jgi:hypothetical protein